jgi:WD40 repeat protein
LRGHEGKSITSAKFSRDGLLALTVGDDQTIRVWDARRSNEVAVLKSDQPGRIEVSPQGSGALV